jgi:uncharacterized protein YggE
MRLVSILGSVLLCSLLSAAQTPEVQFIADTLVVQADGTYEADPDLATMTFQIFSRERDVSARMARRRSRCSVSSTCRKRTI